MGGLARALRAAMGITGRSALSPTGAAVVSLPTP
jgi:hypothetical protein